MKALFFLSKKPHESAHNLGFLQVSTLKLKSTFELLKLSLSVLDIGAIISVLGNLAVGFSKFQKAPNDDLSRRSV